MKNDFFKTFLHFRVEHTKSFHPNVIIIPLLYNEGVGIDDSAINRQTVGQTDKQAYTFLESLRHTDSNGI